MIQLNSSLKFALLPIVCAVSVTAQAEIVNVQINNLISRAINTHPLVQAAISEQKATKEGIVAAKRNLLPTPSISSGYQKGQNVKSRITLRQPLWTGGKLTANVNQAVFDDKAAVENVFEKQNKIAKETIDVWQSYITAVASQRVYQENLKQLAEFEQMMSRRVAQGISAKIELDLMNNRILQQQNAYQASKEQEKIALARLEQIVGDRFATGHSFSVPPLATLTKQVKRQAKNYERMVFDEASFRNATVVKEFFQVESAKQALEGDKASSFPTIYAEYSQNLSTDGDNDGLLSLGMNYEPGAGFSNLALHRASQAKIQSLVQSQEASRRSIMQEIQTKYQKFASAKDKEISLIAAKAGNQIVVASYRRQFIAGRKSWLEVLNALREQNDNTIKLVQTRAEMLGAFYNLQVDLGAMPWQEFQFNRQKQPLFHPLDPIQKWMNTQEYINLPPSVEALPQSLKRVPNHLKNIQQKIQDSSSIKLMPSNTQVPKIRPMRSKPLSQAVFKPPLQKSVTAKPMVKTPVKVNPKATSKPMVKAPIKVNPKATSKPMVKAPVKVNPKASSKPMVKTPVKVNPKASSKPMVKTPVKVNPKATSKPMIKPASAKVNISKDINIRKFTKKVTDNNSSEPVKTIRSTPLKPSDK